MSEQGARAVAAVTRLRVAIEQTAQALARPHLEALLAGEAEIELALAGLPAASTLTDDERRTLRVEIEKASGALIRCRRLGAALTDFVRTTLEVQGRAAYGPRQGSAFAGQSLDERV
jgi:hypothetical protein